MKNIYKYLVSCIVFICITFYITSVNAITVTIGTGTTSQRQPFGMLFGYERSAAIYTNAEIGGTGTITSIGYYVATSSTIAIPVKVYLKTTTASTFTSADTWANMIAGATIDEGTLTFSSTGWSTLNLDTTFSYTGNNLLILVETNYGGSGASGTKPAFNYTSSTSRHQYWFQDDTPPISNGTVNSYRPNVQITYTPFGVTPPANDQCSGAITVVCGSSTNGTTVNATTTGDPYITCGTTITAPGVWYKFTGDGSDVTVDLCGAPYDSKLSIYTGSCASLVCLTGEDDDFTACGDDDPSITFASVSGTTYYFFVHGYQTQTGTFTIHVACNSVTPPNCPNLSSPANNATNVGVASSLNWTAPTGGGNVNYYKLYFGTNNPPTNILNGTNIGNVLTYSPTMSPNTTYYWKVTAVNAAGESSGCTVRQFITGTATDLTIDTITYDPTELVQNYLISGCLEAKNITFKGKSVQIGYFQGGSSTVGYDKGLVLSSGYAKDAEGPNSSASKSNVISTAGDADISAITKPYPSYDAAVLEFDFKPSSDFVSFRYTFASEEYNEFVGTAFNDAFGFFLTSLGASGPQYNKKNIALIPGTSTPVAINKVNNGYAGAYDCGTGVNASNSIYFRDNACTPYKYNIECDGLTTVLTASASVRACEWYHIKLVVADVSDQILDSWVFLEANSFSSGSGVAMTIVNQTGTDISYEGCSSQIIYSRMDTLEKSSPVTLNYTMTGTATSGSDYNSLPNPIVIPAGVNSISIPLNTIIDANTEGQELIICTVTNGGCPCNPLISKDTIKLLDFVGVDGYIQELSDTICLGDSLNLHGIVTKGNYYKTAWKAGTTFISNNTTIKVKPTVTTTYNFTITDSCNNTVTKSITLWVENPTTAPTALNSNYPEYCFGAVNTITLTATGGTGTKLNWYTGSCAGTLIGTGNNLSLPAPATTTTYYAAWSNTGCGLGPCASVTVVVNPLPVANAGKDTIINNGTSITLNGTASAGTGNYNYLWSPADKLDNATIEDPTTTLLSTGTLYTLLITDPTTGCTATDQVIVGTAGDSLKVISLSANPNAICLEDSTQLVATASGGSLNFTYSWYSIPAGFSSNIPNPWVKPIITTDYVIVVDDLFKSVDDTVTVAVNPLPVKYTILGSGTYCNDISGLPISLSNSEIGVNYILVNVASGSGVAGPIAGTGAPISFGIHPAGSYYVWAENATTKCQEVMDGIVTININPTPTLFNIAGNGEYCASDSGVIVTLSNSELGIDYALFHNGIAIDTLPGTGTAISFGYKPAGLYTIIATNTTTLCMDTMSGAATVVVNPLPTKYNVLGNGEYCFDDQGVVVSLSNSQLGVNYELFKEPNFTPTGIIVAGTGSAIEFGYQPAGVYTVVATNITTLCTDTMTGTATVIMNPLPTPYAVTGTAEYCESDSGVVVGLNDTEIGIDYTLLFNGLPIDTMPGTGSAINFGYQAAGVYYIVATNTTTGCQNIMLGNATVIVNPLPIKFALSTSGNGEYCASDAGVSIILNSSQIGVNYFLQKIGASTGINKEGTGSALIFPNQTAGTYIIIATDTATGCLDTMSGNATIIVNALPVANAGLDVPICIGSSIGLSASGGTQYVWSPATGLNSTTIANPTANPTVTTQYTVTVTDDKGCTDVDDVSVTVNLIPSVSLTDNLINHLGYLGNNIVFTATPTTYNSYTFFENTTNVQSGPSNVYQTTKLISPTCIYVIAEENNCYSPKDSICVNIHAIPNAFTPDGDSYNSLFMQGVNLEIWNRWGESIYKGTAGWDGKYKGKIVSKGTYFYAIRVSESNIIKGTVTVISNIEE